MGAPGSISIGTARYQSASARAGGTKKNRQSARRTAQVPRAPPHAEQEPELLQAAPDAEVERGLGPRLAVDAQHRREGVGAVGVDVDAARRQRVAARVERRRVVRVRERGRVLRRRAEGHDGRVVAVGAAGARVGELRGVGGGPFVIGWAGGLPGGGFGLVLVGEDAADVVGG